MGGVEKSEKKKRVLKTEVFSKKWLFFPLINTGPKSHYLQEKKFVRDPETLRPKPQESTFIFSSLVFFAAVKIFKPSIIEPNFLIFFTTDPFGKVDFFAFFCKK